MSISIRCASAIRIRHAIGLLPMLLLLGLLMFPWSSVSAQTDSLFQVEQDSLWQAQQDSLWRDLGLNPEGFDMESDLFTHYSHGWFPQAHAAQTLSLIMNFGYADVFDAGDNIRSRSFVPTTAPFSWHNPFESGERKILKPNSDETIDEGYPFTSFLEYGASYTVNLPMPVALRADASLQIADGLLFSNDTSRSFLTLSGLNRPFKEVGVLYLQQYALAGRVGLNIPVYGVFLGWDALTVSSYYYVHASAGASYTVSSKATQYAQIANVKDELRYDNGMDTVTLMDHVRLPELNRLRTSFDVALGWNFAAAFGTFFLEAYVSVPTNSILTDADWRQYYVGLRAGLGYQWLPEAAKK